MRIHEYEAKKLFRKFKITIPRGGLATSPDSSLRVAEEIERELYLGCSHRWFPGLPYGHGLLRRRGGDRGNRPELS